MLAMLLALTLPISAMDSCKKTIPSQICNSAMTTTESCDVDSDTIDVEFNTDEESNLDNLNKSASKSKNPTSLKEEAAKAISLLYFDYPGAVNPTPLNCSSSKNEAKNYLGHDLPGSHLP